MNIDTSAMNSTLYYHASGLGITPEELGIVNAANVFAIRAAQAIFHEPAMVRVSLSIEEDRLTAFCCAMCATANHHYNITILLSHENHLNINGL